MTQSIFVQGTVNACNKKQSPFKLDNVAVLVDMEEGVVQELLRSQLGSLFESNHLITDVSGSGNNWAVGHCLYGNKYSEKILEVLRTSVEACSSLQCFFVLHSMGGGTGSGIGSFISQLLADEYPNTGHNIPKLVTAVFPSLDDDVITSPYNTVLALNHLTEFADCVLSVENGALNSIVRRAQAEPVPKHLKTATLGSVVTNEGSLASTEGTKPFDAMNNIVANMLLNLTRLASIIFSYLVLHIACMYWSHILSLRWLNRLRDAGGLIVREFVELDRPPSSLSICSVNRLLHSSGTWLAQRDWLIIVLLIGMMALLDLISKTRGKFVKDK
ncbi:unnamed protein product [Schistocephalus solidus]|uniref:Tubulin domain-containing protein n=1 Tax=Schistocephalus solidus TaxID=70667 RepID=A0A183S907_SCHSO|nr:unnamed protein product [Schistocephalus solidus]